MLKFLGSGGAFNVKRRSNSAYFEMAGELFLFDVGDGIFEQIIKYDLLKDKSRINIFITHLHADHVGGLGTLIAYLYFKVFDQDMSNICVYFPSESISKFLELQGVSQEWYNLFLNRWDELFIPGFKKQPEYVFDEVKHTNALDYEGTTNTYSIEFGIEDDFKFYYSGDTCEFASKLQNINNYDYIYHEVTMIPESPVHTSYQRLLEETKNFSKEERAKIYLMHLDEEFDEQQAREDGFQVVQNIEKEIAQ
ncbi:metal-dependent hydrolases of the metallobeta-lactamase superfamily [Lachnospiraceae bacterium KM106-2]|nr:metal-dependent hydrolases of the metallobeta-lactamase superfamily [Lachnospiraceae bacterium KM106-2]